MKYFSIIVSVLLLIIIGCTSIVPKKKSDVESDTTTVADTGFTGIKQYSNGTYVVRETTFKNSIKNGLTKTFYPNGKLQRTFWYVDGLKQDSSCWYYEEGQVFRTTPYINDTINGIQKQFYRTGEVKAEIGYSHGCRTMHFKEFQKNGKLVEGYPDLIVKTEDKYLNNGTYRILLQMSDSKANVKYFRGDLTNGVYDTTRVDKIVVKENTGYITLRKNNKAGSSYVGVFAEVLTDFGNRLLIFKKIDLPYNDLQ